MFSKRAMQHTRQAPGRDIHKHFSLAPARSHTITASNKASATAATRNPPPLPDPYKTGPKLAKRRRGHHTCHSTLSLPPTHLPPSLAHTLPHTSNHERAQTVKGGETPPACASPLSGASASSQQPQPQPQPHLPTGSRQAVDCHTVPTRGTPCLSTRSQSGAGKWRMRRHVPHPCPVAPHEAICVSGPSSAPRCYVSTGAVTARGRASAAYPRRRTGRSTVVAAQWPGV